MNDKWQRLEVSCAWVVQLGVICEVTKEMFETIWWVHENLRPQLVDLVEHHRSSKEVWWIRSPEELDGVLFGLK